MFPGLVITDHRIEGDEHFAHQGNGGDLGGFAGGDEAPVEIAERGFAAGGGPGGHVEGGAHGCASAGDGSRSLQLAAVVIEGGQTDQGGDGAAGDATELGQQSEQGDGGDVLDALERLEQLELGKQAGDLADRLPRAIRARRLRFWVCSRRQPSMAV